jgi:membrane protein
MEVLPSWLTNRKAFKKLTDRMELITISKDRVSLRKVAYIFLVQMQKDHIQEKAAAMAFNFILAIFPLVIFLFTLIPYIPIPDLNENIMAFLQEMMPHSIYASVEGTIQEIVSIQKGGLLSFGFILAMYAATNGVVSMIDAFNKCYKTAENRGFFSRFFVAFTLVLIIIFTILISITIGLFFSFYLKHLDQILPVNDRLIYYLIAAFKYATLFFIFWIIISLIYYIAPNVVKRWRFLSIGSFIASVLGVLFTFAFSLYIENFNSYNKIYGSIGTLIGLLIWLFVISFVLLVGFEINASIDQVSKAKKNKEHALKHLKE